MNKRESAGFGESATGQEQAERRREYEKLWQEAEYARRKIGEYAKLSGAGRAGEEAGPSEINPAPRRKEEGEAIEPADLEVLGLYVGFLQSTVDDLKRLHEESGH